ncbi:reverse transcriptase domain-containing protein [Tanacetum coccineum]
MRTRSQTRNRNRQQSQPVVVQPFHLEEPFVNPPLVPMADNRTMAQLLQAPTEGYEDAILIPDINANFELKHGLINLVQNKQFFGHDKEDPHAHIRYFNKITSTIRFPDVPSTSIKLMLFPFSLEGSAHIWLEKEPPRSILTWDDLVSKFINQFFPPSKTTNLRNEITRFQQRFDESFYEAWDRFNDLLRACPHHGFSELHQLDTFYNALNANDQDSLNSAAGGNFLDKMPRECLRIIESKSKVRNSRNKAVVAKVSSNSSTPGISPDVAALTTEFITSNTSSSSNSGTLPSQTVNNPREHVNAITTRSGKTCEGPSTPLVPTPVVSTPLKEPEQNPETSMDRVQKPSSESTAQVPPPEDHDSIFINITKPKAKITVQEPNSPDPDSYQFKLPYPERMKVRERDTPSAQQSRFMKLFKQLRLEIGLKDALIEMPKFNKWLSTLLRNKEKLEEIAITTVNAECSAIILNKVPEKLEDPGKFLIPCALQELDRTNALADSGASINLLPHSIYKQLGLGALKPTRMTLELANRFVMHPMGIAGDVVVRVDCFTFLADFVVVNFEPDPRVPIILGRPFLRTAKALIDLYEEKLTLRVGSDELVFYAEKSEKSKNKQFAHAISVIDFSKDEPFSGSTTNHSDALPPSSSPVKTSDNIEEFADELTLLKKRYVENKNSNVSDSDKSVLLNTPLTDKVECFALEDNIDEIDAFLAMEISTSRSQENVHTNPSSIIESLPTSLIPVEDNDPIQEEIDIFLVPDDLILPGVENDDSEDEDNELPNLDHQDNPSSPRPPPEPPDVCLNFKPATAMRNEDFNQGEIVLSLNVEDVNSFTFVNWTFLPFFTYPEDSPVILSLSGD